MSRALAGTPFWAWAILAYLVWTGLRAMRDRTLTPASLAILPLVFLALSAWTVLGGTAGADTLAAWALALAAGAAAGAVLARRGAVPAGDGSVHVPGSPTILAVSLLVFAAQWWVGYARATMPEALGAWPLRGAAPILSGLGAGVFAGRAASLLRIARRGR